MGVCTIWSSCTIIILFYSNFFHLPVKFPVDTNMFYYWGTKRPSLKLITLKEQINKTWMCLKCKLCQIGSSELLFEPNKWTMIHKKPWSNSLTKGMQQAIQQKKKKKVIQREEVTLIMSVMKKWMLLGRHASGTMFNIEMIIVISPLFPLFCLPSWFPHLFSWFHDAVEPLRPFIRFENQWYCQSICTDVLHCWVVQTQPSSKSCTSSVFNPLLCHRI